MKLDKIKFARLISYLTEQVHKGTRLPEVVIESIDELVDVEVPEQQAIYPQASDVNQLMELMAAGTQKIEAIKLYRKLTGWGLKDSKDQVEKYWKAASHGYTPPNQDHTLGDILASAMKGN